MASQDNLIRLKRSAVPWKFPTTTALDFGELAINTYNGHVFLKRDGDNGEEIVQFRGNPVSDSSVVLDSFTGDGATTDFTLTVAPEDEQYALVTINGVDQNVSAYTVSGKTLSFSEAPDNGDDIEVRTIAIYASEVKLQEYTNYVYQPSGPQAVFSGQDINSNTLSYQVDKIEAYVNGVRLVRGLDYTATDGTSVSLTEQIDSGDTLEIVSLARASFVDQEQLRPNSVELTSSTVGQVVDTFPAAAYRTAKYLISMSSGSEHHAVEVLLIHDGTNVYISEYGTVFTSNSLGTYDADIDNGQVRLLVDPVNTNTDINVQRLTVRV